MVRRAWYGDRVPVDVNDLTLSEEDRRELITWAMACVERLLEGYEREHPDDDRLRLAVAGARSFARGEATVGQMRKFAFACHAAAREAGSAEAVAVARACGQAASVAHMAGHSREIPRYTAKALQGHRLSTELDWQKNHIPESFWHYVYRN